MDASVYSEAKGEYTKQLSLFIVPAFHRFFMELLHQSSIEEPQIKRQLWKFQEFLSQIPEWNMDKVQREVQKLVSEIHCDYLEELITAVFIAHTKVLTAIRVGNKNKRVQITIPKIDHFLHRALSESSRLLWSSAYLFNNEISAIEKQKNHRQIEQLLHDGIAQAIRGLLPVKSILKDYLAEPDGDEGDDEGEDEEDETHHKSKSEDEHEVKKDPIEETTAEEVKLDEVKIDEVKAEEVNVDEVKLDEVKVEEVKAEEVKAEEVKAEEVKAEEVKLDEVKAEEVKIEEVKAEEVKAEEVKAEEVKLDEPIPTPTTPRLVVETEPSVRFTDFDQVIQQRGDKTHIDYIEKNRELQEVEGNEEFEFLDDDGQSLSDYEEIDIDERNKMEDDDYEVLS